MTAARTRGDRAHGGRSRPVTIVMYHAVSPEPGPYCVSPSAFRRQVEAIASACPVVPLASVPERLAGDPDGRCVVLTFDDAFEDFHSNAFPVLAGLGLPSTVFVPTGFMGGWNDWDFDVPGRVRRRVMSAAQLRAAKQSGLVDLGSHTKDHVRMSRVSLAEMRRQAVESKARLEDVVAAPVTSFAYPYGQIDDFSDASTRVLDEAGYSVAATTHWGTRNSLPRVLELRRISFDERDGVAAVRRKIDGWHDWRGVKERAGSALRRLQPNTWI